MEIYETVQLKYFFEYLKNNNNIYKLNEKEKINAIASDLLSKTPSLKYIVKQCIDNEIFLSLYNIDALDEPKQRELLNRNFQKMCNLMSIKEDIAIEIIAVFLESNGVLIDKDLLKLNVHENNYGYMVGYNFAGEYQYVLDCILTRFPQYQLGRMLALDLGYYCLVSCKYEFAHGEYVWLIENCLECVTELKFTNKGNIDVYRRIINDYLYAQLLLMKGNLGEAFVAFSELNLRIKDNKPAIKRDGRLFLMWLIVRLMMHIIKKITGILDGEFINQNKSIYRLLSSKQIQGMDLWFNCDNTNIIPILDVVGDPSINSIYDDNTRWRIEEKINWEIFDRKIRVKSVGQHKKCEEIIEIKCNEKEMDYIKCHQWDNSDDAYKDYIQIIIDTKSDSFSWL